ncbi:MAG: NAD(+) diphosphatase [Paraglaciecola sp.]|nr:NAD(+) diphosphatase [Paraglaciecola sp.]NCT47301.1 NAD(+) diphosphatase [Paraglaciecola sp.]
MIEQNIKIEADQIAIWLVVSGDKLLQISGQVGQFERTWQELSFAHAYQDQIVKVGEYRQRPCLLVDMGNERVDDDSITAVSMRALLMQVDEELFGIVARAWQIALFMRTHRFCGQCGATMRQIDWEMALQCSRCQHRCYPRISPCIIVAIRHQHCLLLAQGKAHQSRQMYSTLAGFVESGETLEQAVHREVFEEVGVKIKNLRYFGSQPWPFPHSLMVGFLADYAEGDIEVDGKEIICAQWFKHDELPNTPPTLSIAGQLIQHTVQEIQQSLS